MTFLLTLTTLALNMTKHLGHCFELVSFPPSARDLLAFPSGLPGAKPLLNAYSFLLKVIACANRPREFRKEKLQELELEPEKSKPYAVHFPAQIL